VWELSGNGGDIHDTLFVGDWETLGLGNLGSMRVYDNSKAFLVSQKGIPVPRARIAENRLWFYDSF